MATLPAQAQTPPCSATVAPLSNLTVCAGATNSTVAFTGTHSRPTVYKWTNNNTSIGLAASGTGDLPLFKAVNTTTSPQIATITVTAEQPVYAYVTNNFSPGNTSVINTTSNEVIATIETGKMPKSACVSPDGSRLYLVNNTNSNVSVINTMTNQEVAVITVGSYPQGIGISPDGSRVYVTNQGNNSVSVINTANNQLLKTISVGQGPFGICVSPDGKWVYVANVNPNPYNYYISVINTETSTVAANVQVGDYPYGISISPDGSRVYVSNRGSNSVSVINTATNTVHSTINGFNQPMHSTVSVDGNRLYVPNAGAATVSVINTSTNQLVETIPVGSKPIAVNSSPDGHRIYVANNDWKSVSVISSVDHQVISTIGVGSYPSYIGVSPASCAGTPQTFTITVNPIATLDQPSNQTVCAGTATTAVHFTGSASAYTWTNNNPAIGLASSGTGDIASFTAQNTTSSPQTATITVTPQGDCSGTTKSFTFTVNPQPTATLTSSSTLTCNNPTVLLEAPVLASGVYVFSSGATQINESNTATVSQAGTYSVIVTLGNGCSATSSVEVTEDKTVPTPGLIANSTISCANPTVTLTASPNSGVIYAFSPGANQVNGGNTATVTQAGTYSVVVTSPNGCSASTSVEVSGTSVPPAAPSLALPSGITLPILPNTPPFSLTISGCSGGTVNWTGPNNTSGDRRTILVIPTVPGTLVYQATCTQQTCTSSPASFTVVVENPLVTGSFDGFINGADCGSFRGWAWDRSKPNTAVSIDILDGSTVIATLLADQFRQDLVDNGKGNGRHAFRYTIPNALKDGLPHSLSARVSGSSFMLKDSPKALICEGSASPGGNKPPVPPTPTVLIAPLVAQVGVPFSGTLVPFTDADGDAITYSLNGLPQGLSLDANSRVISGTPTEAGNLVLTYSANDGQLTNSVSFNLTVNPAATTGVTGSFEGFLDKLDCGGIRGWVWDRKLPNTPLTVEFYTGSAGSETVLGSVVANIFRQDLKDAGKGNGAHAYNFTAPAGLANGTLVQARVLGSSFVLKGSPKTYQCANARLSAEEPEPLQVRVLGNPVQGTLLVFDVQGAGGQPLRVSVSDMQGRLLVDHHLTGQQNLERHQLSTANLAPGVLLLRVSTSNQVKTVTVLKVN